jgi:ribulose kinase
MAFTLGIDYVTNSVRALFVDVSDGRELTACVADYPSGKQGILLDPWEEVAEMALKTIQLNPHVQPVSSHLLGKHFLRKYGTNAYYG